MKKVIALLLAAVMVTMLFAGCGQSSAPAETKATEAAGQETETEARNTLKFAGMGPSISVDGGLKANGEYKIAVIVKNMTNPGMVAQVEGAKKAAKDMGFEIIELSPANADNVEDQVSLIDDMVQLGVNGILIHCADSNGIMPGVRRAEAAGIQVIGMGTPAAEETLMRTGPDYTLSGEKVGEYVADQLGGKGKVIILEGAAGAQNAAERLDGLHTVLDQFSEIEIVASQTANWKRTEAMSVMENLLQKYSDVDAIIASNDEMAVGALQAVQAANLKDIMIVGFDGNADCSNAVNNGEITATYNCDWYGVGYVAAAYMVQYLNDQTLPPQYRVAYPTAETDAIVDGSKIENYLATSAWFNY